jgi:BirA family biotin operon repressor/biotin-[acetyl-CoA-carboxylase] ligase
VTVFKFISIFEKTGIMMFNIEVFDIKLDTDFIGRQFVYVDEIDSTNLFLLNKLNKFNTNGTVILAEKQIKGRGRNEKVWYSAKDQNLTFSILLNSKKYLNHNLNLINFCSSLSVALAIENLYQLKTSLKWPNDVLVNRKKVAGILLESTSQGSKIEKLVIGIGMNVNQTSFQGNFSIEPTSVRLELNGRPAERERILAEILNIFEEHLLKLERNSSEILQNWKEKCRMIGEKITVTDGENTKFGIFEDVDNEGYLLLKSKGKIEKIHFGEVSLR